MSIPDLLLPEYDAEMAVTRRVLERVPDDRAEWRPHPKSFPMAHLAQLVAGIPGWAARVMKEPEIDIAPKERPAGAGYRTQPIADILKQFDENAAAGRAAIAAGTEEDYAAHWTLKAADNVVGEGTRYQMLRSTVLNHLVHHRAQLGVYLRLVDVPVPQMYGPTADEKMPGGR